MRCCIAWRFHIKDISCILNSSSCFGFPYNVFMNFVGAVTAECGGQRKYPHFLVYFGCFVLLLLRVLIVMMLYIVARMSGLDLEVSRSDIPSLLRLKSD